MADDDVMSDDDDQDGDDVLPSEIEAREPDADPPADEINQPDEAVAS